MKKITLFAFALLFTNALAQTTVAPKAADFLEKARIAHGGDALEKMTSYRDTGTYTIYQNGVVAAEVNAKQIIDLANERIRLEIYAGKAVIQIQQATPQEAWTWTPSAGVVKLPKAQAKPLRDGLYQGLFGLRQGAKDRDAATSDGIVDLGNGLKGNEVSVTTKGAEAKYVFDDNGLWIGAKEKIDTQEVLSLQSNYQIFDGVKLPTSSKTSIDNKPFIDILLTKVEINPALTDADFAKPQ